MFGVVRRFLADENGPTAVEYAVMLAMILLSVMVGISAFGSQAIMLFGNSNTKMSAAGLGS
jgi:pilus assembly protein Flp/PilA